MMPNQTLSQCAAMRLEPQLGRQHINLGMLLIARLCDNPVNGRCGSEASVLYCTQAELYPCRV
jgi:hypothetical protein